MDVGVWLRGLGLGQYEEKFRDNKIDADVLPQLTADDLKDIGVTAVGDRRRLLAAIAALAGATPSASAASAEAAAQPAAGPAREASAERRQLTIMFCDLVGSTALSARMDPEDMRAVIAAYHKAVAGAVQGEDGFVAKYMGDGVLAYFGYPRAHEDDAERAVRAGLAIVESAPNLETAAGGPLHVRAGIATGIVVVGDIIGSGESQERGVVGDTPNLAARLQGIAAPDSVVIAESTRRLLGDLFELKDLGPQELKGVAGSTRAFAALRAGSQESRFEALHVGGLTALVGREEETELLLRRWARAKAGAGQVVLLAGEAGIGKSRLAATILEHLAGEPHTRLRYFCSPQHTDSPLYPIIGHMERAARLSHEDNAKTRLDKLDALLAASSTSCEDMALLADMLSLPNDGRYPAPGLTPQQRRQKTQEALISQVEALARHNPTLMILEDAHWSDPTSLELFSRLVDRIQALRVLLIVTFRPEFEPPWIGRPHVTALTLNRLARQDVIALIDRVVGNKPLPASVRVDIVERTDGVPLFVEEMTKAVLEAEDEGAAERLVAAVPAAALAVPASLHASLMARLDRLGRAREIAQVGAAIGREFSHALVASVAPEPESEVTASLNSLIQAGLLYRQGAQPHATYLFKHALVRDAAYGTLMREPRRALHARIAATLESQFAEIVEVQPELLARHCAEAGLIEKAASLWGTAGQRSLARSALAEAVAQLTRALALIAALPSTPTLRREQIKLQVALITPLHHVKGYAAPETKVAVERARLLIERAESLRERSEDPLLLFSVLYGFWAANYVAFNGDACRDLAAQFLALAEKQGANVPLMIGHRLMGTSLMFTGEITQGRAHYDQAIALYDPAEHRALAARFGQDVRVAILSYRSLALWLLGYPEAALADLNQAINDAREFGQAATLMYALGHAPLSLLLSGNYVAAARAVEEVVALADEKNSPLWKAAAMLFLGCTFAFSGKASDAVEVITAGTASWRETGSTLWTPFHRLILAWAHAQLGQMDDAWSAVGEATTAVETTKERWCEAEVYRIAGETALMCPEPDAAKAQAYFDRALALARVQQAKSWELRAAMSIARLLRDQGKRTEARELLAPVYGWFTEGFDTLDLKEAKALLGELA